MKYFISKKLIPIMCFCLFIVNDIQALTLGILLDSDTYDGDTVIKKPHIKILFKKNKNRWEKYTNQKLTVFNLNKFHLYYPKKIKWNIFAYGNCIGTAISTRIKLPNTDGALNNIGDQKISNLKLGTTKFKLKDFIVSTETYFTMENHMDLNPDYSEHNDSIYKNEDLKRVLECLSKNYVVDKTLNTDNHEFYLEIIDDEALQIWGNENKFIKNNKRIRLFFLNFVARYRNVKQEHDEIEIAMRPVAFRNACVVIIDDKVKLIGHENVEFIGCGDYDNNGNTEFILRKKEYSYELKIWIFKYILYYDNFDKKVEIQLGGKILK